MLECIEAAVPVVLGPKSSILTNCAPDDFFGREIASGTFMVAHDCIPLPIRVI